MSAKALDRVAWSGHFNSATTSSTRSAATKSLVSGVRAPVAHIRRQGPAPLGGPLGRPNHVGIYSHPKVPYDHAP